MEGLSRLPVTDDCESRVSERLGVMPLDIWGLYDTPFCCSCALLSFLWSLSTPLWRPGVCGWPGPGVVGLLSKVKSPLLEPEGGFASGAPTLLYGRSGCREYGKSGKIAVTFFAEPVLHAEIIIQRSTK